jgi:hypothetical protein
VSYADLTEAMKRELCRHARATLANVTVPWRLSSFQALARRGLVVKKWAPGLGLLTVEGWKIAGEELAKSGFPNDDRNASLAAQLGTGTVRLGFERAATAHSPVVGRKLWEGDLEVRGQLSTYRLYENDRGELETQLLLAGGNWGERTIVSPVEAAIFRALVPGAPPA